MFGIGNKKLAAGESVQLEKAEEILAVVEEICRGKFEARIKDIPADGGLERSLCLKINEMIDRTDAYVRESTACLGFIAKNQYFRRIAEHGMLGAFGNATREINSAADGVEMKMEMFTEMVGTISSASQELNATAQSLAPLPRKPVPTRRLSRLRPRN